MKLASISYQQQQRVGVIHEGERCFLLDTAIHGIPNSIEAFLSSERAQVALVELEASGFEGAVEVGLKDVQINPPLKS